MIKNNLERHRVGEWTLRFKMGNILFLTTTTHPKIFVPCESWTDHACKRLEDVSWSPCWVFIGPGPFWLLRVVCHRRELVRGEGGRGGSESKVNINKCWIRTRCVIVSHPNSETSRVIRASILFYSGLEINKKATKRNDSAKISSTRLEPSRSFLSCLIFWPKWSLKCVAFCSSCCCS